MARRPCIEPGCNQLGDGPRCKRCRALKQRARNQRREPAGGHWARRKHRGQVNKAGGAWCNHCGGWFEAGGIQIDHRVPIAEGGGDHPGATQALCTSCHDDKSNSEHRYRNSQRDI